MEGNNKNYGRFYRLLAQLPYPGDRADLKQALVLQFTNSRTVHLHEMEEVEYQACCKAMEEKTNYSASLRRQRSVTLHLMQKIGVDTTDWNRINAFCRDARIAGCEFSRITGAGHRALQRKLRAIDKNGGLKPWHAAEEKKTNNNNPLNISILCIPTMTTSNSSRQA